MKVKNEKTKTCPEKCSVDGYNLKSSKSELF